MGRHLSIDLAAFRKSYDANKGVVNAIAQDLACTKMTVYNYCHRFGFTPKTRGPNRDRTMSLYNDYNGYHSVRTLARKYDMSAAAVRNHLGTAVKLVWGGMNPPPFPKPQHIYEVKIVKALLENAKLPIGRTIPQWKLGEHVRVPQQYVDTYLRRLHESSETSPKKNAGLRPVPKPPSRPVHRARYG